MDNSVINSEVDTAVNGIRGVQDIWTSNSAMRTGELPLAFSISKAEFDRNNEVVYDELALRAKDLFTRAIVEGDTTSSEPRINFLDGELVRNATCTSFNVPFIESRIDVDTKSQARIVTARVRFFVAFNGIPAMTHVHNRDFVGDLSDFTEVSLLAGESVL